MRAIEIALKDVKTIARDYKALAIIIAMPIILIVILGAALGGVFAGAETISRFSVAVVDLDGGQASTGFMEVLSHESIAAIIKTVPAASEEDAVNLMNAREVGAAVIIPEGASDFASHDTKSFKVITNPERAVAGQVVSSIVRSYTGQYSAVSAAMRNLMPFLMAPASGSSGGAVAPQGAAGFAQKVQDRIISATIRAAGLFSVTQEKSTWITAKQYYTASMSAMFVLFGGMMGAKSIIEEKNQKTMSRLFSTKATRADIVVGKTLATYLISFLQLAVLVAFTSLVYRTGWGDLRGVLLVTASLALAATGFSMFIAAVARTERMADILENFGVQIMAFLGGCQLPFYLFPPVLEAISKLTVTRWGLDGYLVLMQGQVWTAVSRQATILAAMGLAYLAAGIWRLRLD